MLSDVTTRLYGARTDGRPCVSDVLVGYPRQPLWSPYASVVHNTMPDNWLGNATIPSASDANCREVMRKDDFAE